MNGDSSINPVKESVHLDESITPPYSPLAVMKLDFANMPNENENVLFNKKLIEMPEESEIE